MRKEVNLITCVTNGQGIGPGHTAVAVGATVHSFENAGDWFSVRREESGWKTFAIGDFLQANAFRPVILQLLTNRVDPVEVEKYIANSTADDDDYLSSGVCSSLVAGAIDAGVTFGFDPDGIDTPYRVYHLARRKGIVAKEEVTWNGRANIPVLHWAGCVNRTKADYPDAFKLMDVGR